MSPNKKPLSPILMLALGLFSYSSMTFGTDFTGPTNLSSQEFKELTVNGSLNFNQLKVKDKTEISEACSGEKGEFGKLIIHGTFWGSKIQVEDLEVDNETALEDFKISGNTTIHAPLKAKNGSFNNINAAELPIALYNVAVNNITVKKSQKTKKENTSDENTLNNELKLAGNTVVSGNITFESGDGIVFIRDKTAVIKGKIIGGKLKSE